MQPQYPSPNYNNPYPPPPGGGYGLVLFFNIIGIVLNIVAIVQGAKAMTEYTNNPGRYTETSFRKAKGGRTCGIVGLCLFGFAILMVVMCLAAFASGY